MRNKVRKYAAVFAVLLIFGGLVKEFKPHFYHSYDVGTCVLLPELRSLIEITRTPHKRYEYNYYIALPGLGLQPLNKADEPVSYNIKQFEARINDEESIVKPCKELR